MAIKIGGTTVIDNNRDICNVGNICATAFYGDASSLTNLPSTDKYLCVCLSSTSGAVTTGQPVSAVCTDIVSKTLGDPSAYDATSAFCFVEQDTYLFKTWGNYNSCCHCCCVESYASAAHYRNIFRTGLNNFVIMNLQGSLGYCSTHYEACYCKWCVTCSCIICYPTGSSNDCVCSLLGAPQECSFHIPCWRFANFCFKDHCVTPLSTGYRAMIPCTTCALCNNYSSMCFMIGIPGIPLEALNLYCYTCWCYSGGGNCASFFSRPLPFHGNQFAKFTMYGCSCSNNSTFNCALCDQASMPQWHPGPVSNFTMNISSCTGNKHYVILPVSVNSRSNNCTYCAGTATAWAACSFMAPYAQNAWGMFTFCKCTGSCEVDLTNVDFCANYCSAWRPGYVTKNKRFMYGEQSQVGTAHCSDNCYDRTGLGFLYVTEINDSFVPNPKCGCIGSSQRTIKTNDLPFSNCSANLSDQIIESESEWRFWPRTETCDGWIIATQPYKKTQVSQSAYASRCWSVCESHLKVMAFKPIANNCAAISNVYCICHRACVEGAICYSGWNGCLLCCTDNRYNNYVMAGTCYAELNSAQTTGCFVVYDHGDDLWVDKDLYCCTSGDAVCFFRCYCDSTYCNRNYCNGGGYLPRANLIEVCNIDDVCFKFDFLNNMATYNNGCQYQKMWRAGDSTCCYTQGAFGNSCYIFCIDNATCCLNEVSRCGATDYNDAGYGCSFQCMWTGLSSRTFKTRYMCNSAYLAQYGQLGSMREWFNYMGFTGLHGWNRGYCIDGAYCNCYAGNLGCSCVGIDFCAPAVGGVLFGWVDVNAWTWLLDSTCEIGKYTDTNDNIYSINNGTISQGICIKCNDNIFSNLSINCCHYYTASSWSVCCDSSCSCYGSGAYYHYAGARSDRCCCYISTAKVDTFNSSTGAYVCSTNMSGIFSTNPFCAIKQATSICDQFAFYNDEGSSKFCSSLAVQAGQNNTDVIVGLAAENGTPGQYMKVATTTLGSFPIACSAYSDATLNPTAPVEVVSWSVGSCCCPRVSECFATRHSLTAPKCMAYNTPLGSYHGLSYCSCRWVQSAIVVCMYNNGTECIGYLTRV